MKFNIINFVECIFLYSFDYSINEIAQIKYWNKALAIIEKFNVEIWIRRKQLMTT